MNDLDLIRDSTRSTWESTRDSDLVTRITVTWSHLYQSLILWGQTIDIKTKQIVSYGKLPMGVGVSGGN